MACDMKHFLVALALVAPSIAHADPDIATHSRVGATLGLGTPIGAAGIEYTQSLGRHAEIGAGVGEGLFMGPQLAIMPRLRATTGATTFSFGAGLSAGQWYDPDICNSDDPGCGNRIKALWANLELGAQWTSARGYFVRGFAGAGKIVADTAPMCQPQDGYGCYSPWGRTPDGHWTFQPYAGVTVGKAF
jgi:hypothetical protein